MPDAFDPAHQSPHPPWRPGGLRWRIVGILLAVSLLPVVLLAGGAWVVFGRMLVRETLALERSMVDRRATAIDLYLQERVRALDMIARSHHLEELLTGDRLEAIFRSLGQSYPGAFVDLGVIASNGAHLAYVGPYDLHDKNYANTPWFRAVTDDGSYVSDVFLGFRQVPHCVVAVRRNEVGDFWILRATINSDNLHALVGVEGSDETSDVFIVNREGLYQTPPQAGRLLDASPIASPLPHRGVRDRRLVQSGRNLVQVTTWLNNDRWLLVVQRDEAAIKTPVYVALMSGATVMLIAIALVIVTTVVATWHLSNRIDQANQKREELSRDFLRSAKLASVGELAAGFAHEINNPLAIISAEMTNLGDMLIDLNPQSANQESFGRSIERCHRQVSRCSGITAKMLQFARKGDTRLRTTNVVPCLQESVSLMQRRATLQNVDLQLRVPLHLPSLCIDPTELEQLLVNLINNSLAAIDGPGTISVSAHSTGAAVDITVRDTGCGIPPEHLDRIFQPFFTTKPPGEGTGLGLAVSYGIVRGWGGSINARSEVRRGTSVTVTVPIPDVRAGPARLEVTASVII